MSLNSPALLRFAPPASDLRNLRPAYAYRYAYAMDKTRHVYM